MLTKINKLRQEMIDDLDNSRNRGRTEILMRDMVIRSLVKGKKVKDYLVLGHTEDFAKNYLMKRTCQIMDSFGVKFKVNVKNNQIITRYHNIFFRSTDYKNGPHFPPARYCEVFEDNSVEQKRIEKRIDYLGMALDVR